MARKSTKTEVKATETAIGSKVEDIKTEDKATETKVAEETATSKKKAPAKKTAPKTEEAKAPKEAVKETKETGAKETAEKTAKTRVTKAAAKDSKETDTKAAGGAGKKAEVKCSLQVQYAGKAYGQEELEKKAREIWKGELKQKAGDLKSIELYVKPEENKVYYVMNGEFKGSFDI